MDPKSSQSLTAADGNAPDWLISPEDISICLKEDGAEHLLGKGAFGKVCPHAPPFPSCPVKLASSMTNQACIVHG